MLFVDTEFTMSCYDVATLIERERTVNMKRANPDTSEKNDTFFSRLWKFVKRRKKMLIFLLVLIIIVSIVLNLFGGRNSAADSALMPQTMVLERMDLHQIVSGTGTLQSRTTREVTSNLSYEIVEVFVEEGDRVEAKQPLAQLDTSEIDESITDTRKKIADAEAQDATALAQAERKLQDAINTRNINWTKNDTAVQAALTTLNSTPSNYATIADAASVAEKAALTQAESNWNSAKAMYALTDADGATLNSGDNGYAEWTALQTAQATYSNKWNTAYAAAEQERANAQSAYDRAVETRDTTYRNDSISVENAQDAVDNQKQKDSAASYRTQLEGYLKDKEKCTIIAPISGTITAMTAEVGNSAGGSMGGTGPSAGASSSLFTIEDTNQLEIKSSIPEYDAVLIRVGMQVAITSDAIDGAEWVGSVRSLSTKATDDSGNFTVVVSVTSPVGELAIGMSTKINIITESKNNVFAVPYDAVTTNAAGETVVYEYIGGAAGRADNPDAENESTRREIKVATGMETDYYIEISSDELHEGMVILTDPEGRNVTAEESGGMGGFPMGGRGL